MKNSKTIWTRASLIFLVTALCLTFTLTLSAQVQTKTSTTSGKATVTTEVKSGEIVFVSGNSVVVKMADGSLRHFDNIPESARVTVDGQQLGVHDLKAGMKVQKTITTTTTPRNGYHGEECDRKGVVCESSQHGHPDHGRRKESGVQDSEWPEIQRRWTDGRCLGSKKGMTVNATKVVETPRSWLHRGPN